MADSTTNTTGTKTTSSSFSRYCVDSVELSFLNCDVSVVALLDVPKDNNSRAVTLVEVHVCYIHFPVCFEESNTSLSWRYGQEKSTEVYVLSYWVIIVNA